MDIVKGNSLKRRVIHGGFWSISGHFISQAIRLGGNLITTRLLLPEMFGVMAIANVLFIGIEMFSDLGVRSNIVQSRHGNEPIFLNTAWALQIVRGLVLGLIVLGLSGLIYLAGNLRWFPDGSVYADEMLPLIVAVLSLTTLIGGLESTKIATERRNLTLGRLTVLEMLSQAIGPIVIIAWCNFDRSIWALVAGWFAVSLSRMLLSHFMLPGPNNKWAWDRASLRSLYHFGKWIFASSILGFLLNNGDRILLGAYLSANDLGIYSIAFLMMSAAESLLRKLVSAVSFPALSELYRSNPDSLGSYYYRFRRPIDLLSLFLVGAIFTSGQTIINLLYDDRYHDAGWMLEILAGSLFFTRYEVAGLCYLVLGKPKLLTVVNLVRVISVYVLVPLAFEFLGMKWAVGVFALNCAAAMPIMFFFNQRNGLLNIMYEIKVLPVLLIGLGFGVLFSAFIDSIKIAN